MGVNWVEGMGGGDVNEPLSIACSMIWKRAYLATVL